MRYVAIVCIGLAAALCSCGGGGAVSSEATASEGSPSVATLATPASSGIWSLSRGPWNAQNSGKLNAVAIDPDNSQDMYVAGGIGTVDAITTDAGVFATSDGAHTWQFANAGLTDRTVNWLMFDGNGALNAATEAGGIYRSANGAQSWTQTSSQGGVRQIVQCGNSLYATAQAGLLVSSTGLSWTLAFPTETQANALATDGANLYVGLVDGTLLKINPNGAQAVLTQFGSAGSRPIVHAVVLDPIEPASIYVTTNAILNGIYTDALFHSGDGGKTWSQITIPAALRGAQAIGFSTVTQHLLYVAGIGLAKTTDGITFQMSSGYGDARGLTVLPNDKLVISSDQGVGVGTYAGGFTPVTAGFKINIVRTVAIHGSTLLVTMQDFGPAVSFDAGSTWQSVPNDGQENGVAYVNPQTPSLCYMLDIVLNVSTNGCATFTQQATGSLSGSNEPFATSPGSNVTYVVTGSGVWTAPDGVHFAPANWSVPGPVDIAIDPRNANSIYVSTAADSVTVWHSTNGGKTFTSSQALVPPGLSYQGNAPVLAVDPANGDVIAATETALYRSTNGGASFTALAQTESFDATQRVRQAAKGLRDPDSGDKNNDSVGFNLYERAGFVPTPNGTMLVLTTSQGLFASLDDGSTLHSISADAISHAFEGFTLDSSGDLCAGTDGEGVICAPLSNLAAVVGTSAAERKNHSRTIPSAK